MSASVCVTGLSKTFRGEKRALFDGLDFRVADQEFLAIFGPNGCGKSTILRMLGGLLKPDAGSIQVQSKTAEGPRIGYVPQSYEQSLMPWLSGLDNIALPMFAAGRSDRYGARDQARDFVASLAISLPLDLYPHEMSGGQRQLTAILRALLTEPELLLLDEPFSALDYLNRLELIRVFERIWRLRPVPTVFVSHDIEDALMLADRVLVLSGRPTEIIDEISIPLPRPRDAATIAGGVFGELKARAISHFLPVSS